MPLYLIISIIAAVLAIMAIFTVILLPLYKNMTKKNNIANHRPEGSTCTKCKSTHTMIKQGSSGANIKYHRGQRYLVNYCIDCENNFYTVDLPPYRRR